MNTATSRESFGETSSVINIPATTRVLVFIAIVALGFQLAMLALTLPLGELGQGKGLFNIDNPYHLYQIDLGRRLLEQGLLSGYDPFFGAGYVGGIVFNVSARLALLGSALVPASISTNTLYLFYVVACALSAPLATVGMAAVLRWPVWPSVAAVVIGLLFWWVGPFHWYHTAGLASYVSACYCATAFGAWAWAICARAPGSGLDRGQMWPLVAVGIVGGLGFWLHTLFSVVAAVMFAALLVVYWAPETFGRILQRASVVACIAVALNLPWLMSLVDATSIGTTQPYQQEVGFDILFRPLLNIGAGRLGSLLNPLSFLLCGAALLTVRGELRRNMLPFVLSGIFWLIFGAFGASMGKLGLLQPNRFLACGFLQLGFGAAYFLARTVSDTFSRQRRSRAWLAIAAIALALALPIRELVREVTPGSHGRHGMAPPQLSNAPADVTWLESWIKTNTTAAGRILFETSLGRVHGGGHTAGYLALRTEREFIGGAYPFMMPQSSFWDGFGFGRPLSELSAERLAKGLDLYNVGWVIAHSVGLVDLLRRSPGLTEVADQGVIHVFRADRPLSFVEEGSARVESRAANRVRVSDVGSDALTLRYHWVPGLATEPPAKVEAVTVASGFPPMVRIVSPPERFDLMLKR